MRQVLKMALYTLELCNGAKTAEGVVIYTDKEIAIIKEALAQPERDYERGFIDGMQKQMQSSVDKAVNRMAQPEQDNAYIYASNLAKTIWQKHYMKESPKFALLDTTEGVLTQIDNMTCGLVREKPAQPEQEPMAWMNDSTPSGIFARHTEGAKNFGCTIPLYTTPPQRTWVGLTDEEIADCAEKMEASDPTDSFWREFFRGIEAKLKEKNT
jgi:hypothetical protein